MVTIYESYGQALEAHDGIKNLLVGNGLSMAFNREIFSYQRLLEAARFGNDSEIIREIFQNLGTSDFEAVANSIATSLAVAKSYKEEAFSQRLETALADLKNGLIQAVRENHPATRNEISEQNARNLKRFLKPFLNNAGNVFSLNYDLLVYWSLLRTIEGESVNFADGFAYDGDENYVSFAGDGCARQPNVFFPHGTLFFFEKDHRIVKPRGKSFSVPIIDVISNHFDRGIFPVFVSEGNSLQKLKRIRQNRYLNYCFDKFLDCSGSFFIYGHSLDLLTDGHILEKIAANPQINAIVSSFYGDELERQNVENKLINLRIKIRRPNLRLGAFPAQTADCW